MKLAAVGRKFAAIGVIAASVAAAAQPIQVGAEVDFPGPKGWERGPIVEIDQRNNMVKVQAADGFASWFGISAIRPPSEATKAPVVPAFPGSGPVTREEIDQFINRYGVVNAHYSQSPQVCKAVTDAIMARGAGFRFAYTDSPVVAQAGCVAGTWSIPTAAQLNQGPPKGLAWLIGNWSVSIIAPTVDRLHTDGWVYRREEFGARAGGLVIGKDSRYTWQQRPGDPPAAYIQGRWRLATPAEMGLQGGAGIVLLRGEGGADWIVYPWWGSTDRDMLEIENLDGRGGQRRLAVRR